MYTALLPLLIALLPALVHSDVITGIPDSAPPGFEEWVSPVVVPARPVSGSGDWASSVARARQFVSQLTLEEKVNVTTGTDLAGRCVGNTGTLPRFNWPGLCLQDSPLGVRFVDNASAFPAAINVAATWDRNLIQQRGQAIGSEHRGKGVNVMLGPMMNLARAPEAGRNWEGFGGDPFLSGVGASLTVKGVQSVGVIATAKHFIGNEQEHYRGGSLASQIYSSNVDDKTMHEVFLWPFAESAQVGVGAYMCAYNKINQTQACQNSKILNGLLKEELDFQGFIMSDWAAMINGVQPALAGLDMNMPGFMAYGLGNQEEADPVNSDNSFWGANLVEAVNNGSVPESRVDDMVTRIFAAYYQLGQNENYPPVNFDVDNRPGLNENVNVQDDHAALIREIGGASAILLKNTNNALPLSLNKIKTLGIIGSDATANPAGPNACTDRGCNTDTLAMGWGSGTAQFPYLVDPLSAISGFISSQNSGVVIKSALNDTDLTAAVAAASAANTCLVFVTADSGEGYITVEGNAGDRNDLQLWHGGDALINATASVCSDTIVVIHTVGAVIMEAWIDNPNVTAVVNAGLPGQESGNALVDVLFGSVNPSGKLPYTIGKSRNDYAADILYSSSMQTPQITYAEGPNIDYRWFDSNNIAPRFEFGFGLSYTTFSYSNLHAVVVPSILTAGLYGDAVVVTYFIKNTGKVAGSEVSQAYIGFPDGNGEPPKVLRGFEKTPINPGANELVTLTLRRKDVSVWDSASQEWVIPQGTFTLFVGASSRNLPLQTTFSFH